MTVPETKTPFVAIACGGTGGHLFPGLAVAEQLQKRGCGVALLISPKDIDQQAVKAACGVEIFTLPAVGLQNRNYFSFAVSFVKSLFAARKIFPPVPARCRPRDGRIYQRAAGSGGERTGGGDIPPRIQHHSRPRQPISCAVRGRGVRRFPRSGSAPESAQNDGDRHAGSPAIPAARSRRLPDGARTRLRICPRF